MNYLTPTEMIKAVIDRYGENEAFAKLDIDRKTYYNYKQGGNPNPKKLKAIKAIYRELSENAGGHAQKNPGEPGLLQKGLLNELEDKKEIIRLLKEKEISYRNLEASLKKIEKDLADLARQVIGDKKKFSSIEPGEEVMVYDRESNAREESRK